MIKISHWIREDGLLWTKISPKNEMLEGFLNMEGHNLLLCYDKIVNSIHKIQSEQISETHYFSMHYIIVSAEKVIIFDAFAGSPGGLYDEPTEIELNDFLSLLARYREIYYQTVGEL